MRVAPAITLTNAKRRRLRAIAQTRRAPLRLIQRARIVLLAEDGLQNIEIAKRVGASLPLVGRWRGRYAVSGLAGIEKDAPRSGRKPKISPELVQAIVRKTT